MSVFVVYDGVTQVPSPLKKLAVDELKPLKLVIVQLELEYVVLVSVGVAQVTSFLKNVLPEPPPKSPTSAFEFR